MLQKAQIKGLLPLEIRKTNGQELYYYEISTKQPLHKIFENKAINYDQLCNIIKQINQVLQQIELHFLESKYLLFYPEYFFLDLESFQIYMVIFLDHTMINNGWSQLIDYFLEHIDYQDENVVHLAYNIYRISKRDNFIFEECMLLIGGQAIKQIEEPIDYPQNNGNQVEMNCNINHDNRLKMELIKDKDAIDSIVEIKSDTKKEKRCSKIELICICLGTLLIIIGCILNKISTIYYKEALICIGIAILAFAVFVVAKVILNTNRKCLQEERRLQDISIPIEEAKTVKDKNKSGETSKEMIEEVYGNTILLNDMITQEERVLQGMVKGNKIEIVLTEFPFTIGKLQWCVDYALNDDSISRMHARFLEIDSEIYLEDLNSTNGTYKNSIPLEIGETVKVSIGDEIRFADIIFNYY